MRQSEEGRLYFGYGLGAEIQFTPGYCASFIYRIVECDYEDGTEYFTVECEGKALPRMTLKDFEMVLSLTECEFINEGEPVELPLTLEEVKEYFDAKRKQLVLDNTAANKALKETSYFQLIGDRGKLKHSLNLLVAEKNEKAIAAKQKELEELEKKLDEIIDDLKIDRRVLHKKPDCALCKDSGVINGAICECAYALEDTIKAYSARLRAEKG